jgi:Holliday junction resolvase RusA-like endonuclease
MADPVSFFVKGRGRPKGSKRVVRGKNGRTLLLEQSAKEKPWRVLVGATARLAMREQGRRRFEGVPLDVLMVFGFRRPQKHFLRSQLRDASPDYHTGAPDASKLARSVEDALNKVVWDDDSRVARLEVWKRFCDESEPEGVWVQVDEAKPFPEAPLHPWLGYRRAAGVSLMMPVETQKELKL